MKVALPYTQRSQYRNKHFKYIASIWKTSKQTKQKTPLLANPFVYVLKLYKNCQIYDELNCSYEINDNISRYLGFKEAKFDGQSIILKSLLMLSSEGSHQSMVHAILRLHSCRWFEIAIFINFS